MPMILGSNLMNVVLEPSCQFKFGSGSSIHENRSRREEDIFLVTIQFIAVASHPHHIVSMHYATPLVTNDEDSTTMKVSSYFSTGQGGTGAFSPKFKITSSGSILDLNFPDFG